MSREYPAKLHQIVTGDRLILDLDLGFGITVRKRVRLLSVQTPEARGFKRPEGLHVSEHVATWLEENGNFPSTWPLIAYITRNNTEDVWRAEIYAINVPKSLNDHLIESGWGSN
jgi:hypothetical protein